MKTFYKVWIPICTVVTIWNIYSIAFGYLFNTVSASISIGTVIYCQKELRKLEEKEWLESVYDMPSHTENI